MAAGDELAMAVAAAEREAGEGGHRAGQLLRRAAPLSAAAPGRPVPAHAARRRREGAEGEAAAGKRGEDFAFDVGDVEILGRNSFTVHMTQNMK